MISSNTVSFGFLQRASARTMSSTSRLMLIKLSLEMMSDPTMKDVQNGSDISDSALDITPPGGLKHTQRIWGKRERSLNAQTLATAAPRLWPVITTGTSRLAASARMLWARSMGSWTSSSRPRAPMASSTASVSWMMPSVGFFP